jgi:hypothetical protein
MNSGFYPNVVNPKPRLQTESGGFQAPFFFGGSQTPINIDFPSKNTYETRYKKDFPSTKKISRNIILPSVNF